MKFLAVAAIIVSAAFASVARADFLLEPYAGYAFGSTQATSKATVTPPNADFGFSETELSLGARLGYRFSPGLWIAADPQFGLAGNAKSNANGASGSFTRTQVFADVDWDISFVRFYLGYGFLNQFNTSDLKASGGTAYKVGVSFELVTSVALNVEYHMNTYGTLSSDGQSISPSDFYSDYKESEFLVGLSFPIGMMESRR